MSTASRPQCGELALVIGGSVGIRVGIVIAGATRIDVTQAPLTSAR